MSKHWDPRIIEGGRTIGRSRRGGRGRRWRISAGELRMMVLGGMFVGLTVVFIPGGFDAGRPDGVREATRDGGAVVRDPSGVVIVDGDTFRLAGEKIRIADIDTPEVNGRCAYERDLAAQATARMEELLTAGPFEMHRIERDEDRYGRKLRVVTRDGRSLGDQLVAEGLARTWSGRREPCCYSSVVGAVAASPIRAEPS